MTNYSFIRYANCWEDTESLINTLEENKKILSICSAGDNVLGMLTKNPKEIVAFDINETQLNLLNLKIAAFKKLKYEEILILLGIKKGDSLKLFKKLERTLDKDTYNYFIQNKRILKKGIINSGKFEKYFQLFRKIIIPLFTNKKNIKKLASYSNVKEQKEFYEEKINNKRLKRIFNIFFGFKIMGKYGRDKSFYDHVSDKEQSAFEIKKRFDIGISTIPNKTNPYITYILLNEFTNDALPYYLQKENYNSIKNNINKIIIKKGTLLDINMKFDYCNLSDIFEYMSEEDFNKNINHLDKITKNNCRVLYYNMQNKRYIENKNFVLNQKLSNCLKQKNKSYFYRDVLVYEKEKKYEQNNKKI